ncbi:transposase, MuDR, MULE transposase domain protein [Tanacetum coccineum]
MQDANRNYKVKDIQRDLCLDWNIDISYKRAWGVRSFVRYLRPLIIIDAAHLKGSYKGTNLLAVGMDGNNQILPIAMGVTHGETGASWTWFMNRLKECIGEVPNLCIISDRHPAIILACKTVFNNSFHGYCDRHLMMNCKFKGKKIRGMYWKTCKAYTTHEFDALLAVLRGYRPDGVQKLEIAGFDKWSRAYCPANRFNYMTSNSVESVNSLSRFVRKLPVTRLVEYFRGLLQRWYCDKRQKYEDAPADELTPWAAAKVKDRMLKSQSWRVNGIDALKIYQVFDNKSVHEATHNQKRRSNNTHIRQEPLTREALLDEERLRNGRIYKDWDDLVQEEILPIPLTKNFMGLREWDGPAE